MIEAMARPPYAQRGSAASPLGAIIFGAFSSFMMIADGALPSGDRADLVCEIELLSSSPVLRIAAGRLGAGAGHGHGRWSAAVGSQGRCRQLGAGRLESTPRPNPVPVKISGSLSSQTLNHIGKEDDDDWTRRAACCADLAAFRFVTIFVCPRKPQTTPMQCSLGCCFQPYCLPLD
jgi:hypothetical protein